MQPFCVTGIIFHFSLKTAKIIFCRISGYRFCKGKLWGGYKYSELATNWLQF